MDKEEKWLVLGIFIIGLLICVSVFSLKCIIKKVEAPAVVAKYHALVETYNSIKNDAITEDVLGKIADWNENIAYWKRMNKIPIIELYYPDEVASLEPIII